jgi:hypothetical protein
MDFPRRGFLQGLGAVSLATLAAGRLSSDTAHDGAAAANARRHTAIGALFNPYHRPEDWAFVANGAQPEGLPLLGAYAGYMVEAADSQVIFARNMGLSFFLAAFSPERPRQTDGLDALFEAARSQKFPIGVYIDLEDGIKKSSRASTNRLRQAFQQVSSKYLSHPAYLRSTRGRPIVGVTGVAESRFETELRRSRMATGLLVLHLPSTWRVRPDADDLALGKAVVRGVYLGYSVKSDGPSARVVPCPGSSESVVLVAAARDSENKLSLPSLDRAPNLVILDSFNNWGVSVPLEPGTLSRTTYPRNVAQWCRRLRS